MKGARWGGGLAIEQQGSLLRPQYLPFLPTQPHSRSIPIKRRHNERTSLCTVCGGHKFSRNVRCRDSPTPSNNVSEKTANSRKDPSENGHSSNGNTNGNGKATHSSARNGTSQNGSSSSNGTNGNTSLQKGSTTQKSPSASPKVSMNRNSGPKRPKGTLSPYGDIQTSEGTRGLSLRNGRKGQEKGVKAQQQRGTLDVPENLRQVQIIFSVSSTLSSCNPSYAVTSSSPVHVTASLVIAYPMA